VTPSELDADVVQARLMAMRDLLTDLESVGSVTAADLHRDRILRHAVERILGQLVDLAAAINSHIAATTLDKAPADYRSSFDAAESAGIVPADLCQRLRRSVGLRNVLRTSTFASTSVWSPMPCRQRRRTTVNTCACWRAGCKAVPPRCTTTWSRSTTVRTRWDLGGEHANRGR